MYGKCTRILASVNYVFTFILFVLYRYKRVCVCVCVCVGLSPTMVHWQLCTLEHLMSSWFGRPFPRHGLQLLFWFANHCVTCELVNYVVTMKVRLD